MSASIDVPLDAIDVPAARLRDFDPAWVEALALMIAEQGLLQPIIVHDVRGRWRLVAGRYRLAAMRRLGRATIAATVVDASTDEVTRAELAENLGRAELVALDRCRGLAEMKRLDAAVRPQGRGGDRRSAAARDAAAKREADQTSQVGTFDPDGAGMDGFAEEWGAKFNLSRSAILRCVQIWEGLSRETRQRLPGTLLAANQSELQQLADLSHGQQAKVLDLILDPSSPIDSVRGALDHLDAGLVETAVERKFRLYSEAFAKLSEPQVDQLLAAHDAVVLASLRRRGVL